MKVACLMGTYGRYSLACDALTCFLQQSALEDATMLIYNQHPVPLAFDHPQVRVVNEVRPNMGLRQIKIRMLELAPEDAEFIHFWDDDDLCLPWHLRDGLDNIGDDLAWKPERSWTWQGKDEFNLSSNYFEGTCLYRASYLRAAPTDTHPRYGDHPAFMQLYDQGLVASTELGDLSSYVYRWSTGVPHNSYYVAAEPDRHAGNIDRLRVGMTDTGDGQSLRTSDLWPTWQRFMDGIRGKVSPAGLQEIGTRLSLAQAVSIVRARQ